MSNILCLAVELMWKTKGAFMEFGSTPTLLFLPSLNRREALVSDELVLIALHQSCKKVHFSPSGVRQGLMSQ